MAFSSGGQLAQLQSSAKKLTLELRQGLEKIERAEGTQAAQALSRDMRAKLADLQGVSGEMERKWRVLVMHESSSKRDITKRKVEQIIQETDSLAADIARVKRNEQRRKQAESERAELLMRLDDEEIQMRVQSERNYDPESGAMESVSNSHRMVDDLLATGAGVLASLNQQRERLQGAHRKVFDVLNTTGLSDSLLRMVQRRQSMDAMLVYGGIAFTLCFVWLLWWWNASRGHHH